MEKSPLQQCLEDRIKRQGPNSYINLIDSNFLDNGFIFPPDIIRQGMEEWLSRRSYHPDPKGDLAARQAIARFYQYGGPISHPVPNINQQSTIDPDCILLTASSSESYNLLFQTFCKPGDNILLPQPGYPLFEDLANACHLDSRFYPLVESQGWQPDVDMIEALIDVKTRFVVLISPNNPCGSLIPQQLLQSIIEICHRNQVMVISDEVFSEFLYQENDFPRAADLVPIVPIFTINGLSKLFALPDLKLSWLAVTGPIDQASQFPTRQEIVTTLELRNDTFLSCNSFSQSILPTLFRQGGNFTREMVAQINANRRLLQSKIDVGLPVGVRIIPPQAGIHCIIILSPYAFCDDESVAIQLLQETGIYLHPGYLYGITEETALVMSILKTPNIFRLAIDGLLKTLSG